MLDNLRSMGVFASVVRHGSFSGAAKELGITTSAVSQQIRSLELGLGVSLLHRSTRKLSLTEAGEGLYTYSVQMLKAAEQGRDSVINLKDEISGSLRIATSAELAKNKLLPALSAWLDDHSNLSLNLISDDGVDMIEDRVDLALVVNDGKQGKSLATVPQMMVASPAFVEQHGRIETPKQLSQIPTIHVSEKSTDTLEFWKNTDKTSVRLNSRIYTNNHAIGLELARNGAGVFKTNALMAQPLIDSGELVVVLDDYKLADLHISAVVPSKESTPAKVKKCMQVLEDYFAK